MSSELFSTLTGPQADFDANMEAIIKYMNTTPVHNPIAASVKSLFAEWAGQLSWWDRHMDTDNLWNRARNYRNDFDRANAGLSPSAQKAVNRRIKTGMTSEQMMGQPDAARTATGRFVVEGPAGSKPLIPTAYKIGATAVGAGVVALVILKKFSIL